MRRRRSRSRSIRTSSARPRAPSPATCRWCLADSFESPNGGWIIFVSRSSVFILFSAPLRPIPRPVVGSITTALVRVHDVLHELVAHDVAAFQLNLRDAFDSLELV